MENPEVASLSFDERFGLLVDQHWTWRENQAMAGRLKRSKLPSVSNHQQSSFFKTEDAKGQHHPRRRRNPIISAPSR
jgi:hypothetical protein